MASVLAIDGENSISGQKKKMLEQELANRFSRFAIANDVKSREIIGYIIYWIIEDILEIHHFAVKKRFQSCGVGTALVESLLADARKKSVKQIFLEVRKSNSKAIHLYHKFGFKTAGKRKGYYKNPEEDALVFVLNLDPAGFK